MNILCFVCMYVCMFACKLFLDRIPIIALWMRECACTFVFFHQTSKDIRIVVLKDICQVKLWTMKLCLCRFLDGRRGDEGTM